MHLLLESTKVKTHTNQPNKAYMKTISTIHRYVYLLLFALSSNFIFAVSPRENLNRNQNINSEEESNEQNPFHEIYRHKPSEEDSGIEDSSRRQTLRYLSNQFARFASTQNPSSQAQKINYDTPLRFTLKDEKINREVKSAIIFTIISAGIGASAGAGAGAGIGAGAAAGAGSGFIFIPGAGVGIGAGAGTFSAVPVLVSIIPGVAPGILTGILAGPAIPIIGGVIVAGWLANYLKNKLDAKKAEKKKSGGDGKDPKDPKDPKNKKGGAQAPGEPTADDGFIPKKNWDGEKVKNPNGPGYGWPDKAGNVWVPTGPNGHGGPHWDVQHPDGGKKYVNIVPGGKERGKK